MCVLDSRMNNVKRSVYMAMCKVRIAALLLTVTFLSERKNANYKQFTQSTAMCNRRAAASMERRELRNQIVQFCTALRAT